MGAATTLPRRHETTREGDGYRVHRVPIFAEHERSYRDPRSGQVTQVRVGLNELTKLASRINQRHADDGYLAPVHPVHNDSPNDGSRVAYMCDARVESAVFEGKQTNVLFVDYFVDDSDGDATEKLAAIDSFPYRSPEVNFARGEINSLSLLKREAPFFKFPLFKRSGLNEEQSRAAGVGVAYAAYGDEYSVLYRGADFDSESGDDEMYQDEEEKVMAPAAPVPAAPEGVPAGPADAAPAPAPAAPLAPAAEEEAPQDDSMGALFRNYGAAMGRACAEEFRSHIKDMFAEDDGGLEQEQDLVEEPPVVMASDAASGETINYAMRGEIRALTARLEQIEGEREQADTRAWAQSETQGYSVGSAATFLAEVDELYNDGGRKGVEQFVRGLKAGAPLMPTNDVEVWGDAGAPTTEPEEVARYRGNKSQHRQAITLYQEYQEMSPGLRKGITVSDHIENHL